VGWENVLRDAKYFGGCIPYHTLSIVIIKVVLQCFNNQNSKIQNFYLLV
jgi:hypothetical protein